LSKGGEYYANKHLLIHRLAMT